MVLLEHVYFLGLVHFSWDPVYFSLLGQILRGLGDILWNLLLCKQLDTEIQLCWLIPATEAQIPRCAPGCMFVHAQGHS